MKNINEGDIVRVVGCNSPGLDSYVGQVGMVVGSSFTGWAVQLGWRDDVLYFYPGEIAPMKWRVKLEVRGKGWFTVIAKSTEDESIKVLNTDTFERAVELSRQWSTTLNGWDVK